MLSGKVIHLSQQQRKWNAKVQWKMKIESILENDYEIMQKKFQDSLCFLCSFKQSFQRSYLLENKCTALVVMILPTCWRNSPQFSLRLGHCPVCSAGTGAPTAEWDSPSHSWGWARCLCSGIKARFDSPNSKVPSCQHSFFWLGFF